MSAVRFRPIPQQVSLSTFKHVQGRSKDGPDCFTSKHLRIRTGKFVFKTVHMATCQFFHFLAVIDTEKAPKPPIVVRVGNLCEHIWNVTSDFGGMMK